MPIAAVDWGTVLIGAAVGAILSVVLGLFVVSLFQERVDRLVFFTARLVRRPRASKRPLNGIWRSRYEYTTAEGPTTVLIDEHYIEVRQRRSRITAMALKNADGSELALQLLVESAVLTGTWREHTPARREYHGACQFELLSTRDQATGLWTGFSRTRGVLSGKWTLKRESDKTNRRTRKEFTKRQDLLWQEPAQPRNQSSIVATARASSRRASSR